MKPDSMVQELVQIRNNALAKYSNFKVGALIIGESGKKYSGFNIESSSYGLTICAERVALFKGLSEGERVFNSLFLIGPNDEFCYPCGACRQVLYDYAPNLNITIIQQDGSYITHTLKELLPKAFNESSLK